MKFFNPPKVTDMAGKDIVYVLDYVKKDAPIGFVRVHTKHFKRQEQHVEDCPVPTANYDEIPVPDLIKLLENIVKLHGNDVHVSVGEYDLSFYKVGLESDASLHGRLMHEMNRLEKDMDDHVKAREKEKTFDRLEKEAMKYGWRIQRY